MLAGVVLVTIAVGIYCAFFHADSKRVGRSFKTVTDIFAVQVGALGVLSRITGHNTFKFGLLLVYWHTKSALGTAVLIGGTVTAGRNLPGGDADRGVSVNWKAGVGSGAGFCPGTFISNTDAAHLSRSATFIGAAKVLLGGACSAARFFGLI